MCCLLVENYSNSRQVWSSRSFLQFLWGLRPDRVCCKCVPKLVLSTRLSKIVFASQAGGWSIVLAQDHFYSVRHFLQCTHVTRTIHDDAGFAVCLDVVISVLGSDVMRGCTQQQLNGCIWHIEQQTLRMSGVGVLYPVAHRKACHTFSASWLWSSVVSVLISVTTDMSPTGDLLVTFIFAWGSVLLSLLGDLHVLHWHGTLLGAAYPSG